MADLRPLEAESAVPVGLCLLYAPLACRLYPLSLAFSVSSNNSPELLCFPKLSNGEEATSFNFHIKTTQGQDCD